MAKSTQKSQLHVLRRKHIRLSGFIRENTEPIVSEWTKFAKTLTPAADDMSPLALRDHIEKILTFIADDL